MVGKIGGVMVAAAFVLTGAPAFAQAEPDLAAVLAHIKDAAGVRPHDERIESSFTRFGLSGTEVRIRSGDDYRVDTTTGPLRQAHGSIGDMGWEQNENGETVRDDADAAEPSDETVTASLSRVHDPAELYVVSNLTALGSGSKRYVDPATWRVVRQDVVTPNETVTTTYDDFRTTGGYTRAWHSSTSDGHKENDSSVTITKIDTAAIPANALAVPPSRRTLVEFPAGVTSLVLPARLDDRREKFLVRLDVGGRGLDFLLDTGASGIVLERDIAKSLGLTEFGAYSTSANAGRYVTTRAVVPSIEVGALTMHDVEVETIPPIDEEGEDYRVVGLLGFDFLDALGAKLDYAHGTITAYAPGTMTPPADSRTIALDVRLGSYTPQTDVTVNGALGTRFLLDTGGAGALLINDYFRRRYPVETTGDDPKSNPRTKMLGVGGAFEVQRVRLAEIELGKVRFTDFDAFVLDSPKLYAGDDDGLVGPDLFRLFDVYLDFQNRRVYLTPNSVGSQQVRK